MHFKLHHYFMAGLLVATAAQSAVGQELVVTPQGALRTQVERVSNRLDALLVGCNCIDPDRSHGVSQVRFEADANGRPINVRTYDSTHNPYVDRAAIKVVKRLRDVDALLAAAPGARTVQANILFARDFDELDEMKGVLTGMENARIAREGRPSTLLAVSIGSAPMTP